MPKFFDKKELTALSVSFQFLEKENYGTEAQVLKQIDSGFYQNRKKQKLRFIHKPISKLYDEEDIL
jgi:hypothetical protein